MKIDFIDRMVAKHLENQAAVAIESYLAQKGVIPMNPLEQFAITIILGVLQTVVKNPASKAALQAQLVGVANDIYMAYGMVPPVAPPVA